jgi:uncharacterized protein DUF4159
MRSLRLAFLLLTAAPGFCLAQRPGGAPITIARLQYGGGGDWYVGPSTLPNLLGEIRKRTGLAVSDRPVNLKLTDPLLWNHPFLFVAGHGNINFTSEEVDLLRRYLLSGGFLYADDCYGMDKSFRREMKRVFPDQELVELPRSHPIFHTVYRVAGMPKVHKHDNKPAQGLGIFHEGRLVVFYGYESDIHDGWEDAQVHADPPQNREAAFRMGVNIFMFAMSQATK